MTYEYVCQACGHQWEAEQSIKDAPLKKCEACGKNRAKRLVSGGTGFLLKGGGWYADGYGSAKSNGSAGSSESSSDASASDGAADAKPKTEKKKGDAKATADSSKGSASTKASAKSAKAS